MLNEQKLKTEIMTYKYESLKNQINPHFLFNSFNVLSDLIHEDQKLADSFLSKLSDLYRYVLDSREKELVSLAEELEFIESDSSSVFAGNFTFLPIAWTVASPALWMTSWPLGLSKKETNPVPSPMVDSRKTEITFRDNG